MKRWNLLLAALAAQSLSASAAAAALYYTETGYADGAWRVSPVPGIATATREALAVLPGLDPRGVAVDSVNEQLYYARGTSIERAKLDGSAATTVLTASAGIGDIEVDPVGGKIYFSTIFSGAGDGIYSADLDGSAVTLVQDATTLAGAGALGTITTRDVFNIKVDTHAGLLYWTADDGGVAGRKGLNVSALGGAGPSQLWVAAGRADAISKMDIDFASGTLYYTVGSTTNEVRRSALDNSALSTLVAGVGRPGALAIDVAGDDLYFWVGDTLYAGALDGSGLSSRTFVGSSLFAVSDMELGPSTAVPLPSALLLCAGGLAGLRLAARRRA